MIDFGQPDTPPSLPKLKSPDDVLRELNEMCECEVWDLASDFLWKDDVITLLLEKVDIAELRAAINAGR